MFSIISSSGIRPEMFAHEDKTVAARVDSSDRECRKRDTVSLPLENARSTSVDAAGMDRKSKAMRARGANIF